MLSCAYAVRSLSVVLQEGPLHTEVNRMPVVEKTMPSHAECGEERR